MPALLRAQVDVGVSGGVPLTHFILDTSAVSRTGFSRVSSAPRRYTLGPFLEFRPTERLGVEAGVLYKRFGFDAVSSGGPPPGPIVTINAATTGNSLEFPVLAKIRVRLFPGINGFAGAGPSVRRLFGITELGTRTVRTFFPPPQRTETTEYETDSPEGLNRRTSVGLALGAGIEFRGGPLRLAPGIRLSRWDTERTSSEPSASRIARTQAEVMLSIAHAGGPDATPMRLPCCWEFGLYAGVPLLSTTRIESVPALLSVSVETPAQRFAAGAFIEARFHPRLSVEAGFLTGRFGHTERTVFVDSTVADSLSGYSWEVPLLLKWRATRIRSTPLWIGGGPALRRASHIDWTSGSDGSRFRLDGSLLSRSALGFTAASGLEVRAGKVRLRPELRYSRFERPLYDFYLVKGRRDSLHLILGISPAGRL
jgi:hypothetical protein